MFAVSTLLTVLGLLHGRAGTVSAGDVFLLLGFGFHLAVIRAFSLTATAEIDAVL